MTELGGLSETGDRYEPYRLVDAAVHLSLDRFDAVDVALTGPEQ